MKLVIRTLSIHNPYKTKFILISEPLTKEGFSVHFCIISKENMCAKYRHEYCPLMLGSGNKVLDNDLKI